MGNTGINTAGDPTPEFDVDDGMITYVVLAIDQRVRQATSGVDYMATYEEWFDVQNGADFRGQEEYVGNKRRFIASGRDMATYVHYDALYEAYLNACLILLAAPIVPGRSSPCRSSLYNSPRCYTGDLHACDCQLCCHSRL